MILLVVDTVTRTYYSKGMHLDEWKRDVATYEAADFFYNTVFHGMNYGKELSRFTIEDESGYTICINPAHIVSISMRGDLTETLALKEYLMELAGIEE